jgi:HAMP domain
LRNGGTTSPVANSADARGPQGLGEGGYSYRSQAYTVADRLLLQNARAEIQDNARIMMESALAVRAYTVSQIKPLLDTQMRYKFLPQTVPSIAAEVSKGNMEAPDFPSKGGDEISTLGASFNRMRRSLVEAMNMLQ